MKLNGSARLVRRRGERGMTLAISAIAMTSTLLAVGLSVDIGHLYMVKAEMQHAADAAALAGASALDSSAKGIQTAVTRATLGMNKGDFQGFTVTIPSANVKFSSNLDGAFVSQASAQASPSSMRFIRVTTPPAPVTLFFARLVLGPSMNVTATATGGRSVPLNVICGFAPVSVIDYGVPMVPGQTYTFRAAPSSGPSPGDYQILGVAGSGGRDVRFGLAGVANMCARAGEEYAVDTSPGVKSGPVRQGLNSRFDDYQGGGIDATEFPPDLNVKNNISYNQYQAGLPFQAPTHPGLAGRRLLLIPIIKLAEFDAGRNVVRFNRFGVFFLREKVGSGSGGDVVAEYINQPLTIGQGSYDPNSGAGNSLLSVPVLY